MATSSTGEDNRNGRVNIPFILRDNVPVYAKDLPILNERALQDQENSRASRQRGRDDELDLSIGSIALAGERCINKVVLVEETRV